MSDDISKYREYEGAVPVNGDVTPITRRKVELVDSSQWPNLSLAQLWQQRETLEERITMASQMNQSMANQMKQGLALLDAIIAKKFENQDDDMRLL